MSPNKDCTTCAYGPSSVEGINGPHCKPCYDVYLKEGSKNPYSQYKPRKGFDSEHDPA